MQCLHGYQKITWHLFKLSDVTFSSIKKLQNWFDTLKTHERWTPQWTNSGKYLMWFGNLNSENMKPSHSWTSKWLNIRRQKCIPKKKKKVLSNRLIVLLWRLVKDGTVQSIRGQFQTSLSPNVCWKRSYQIEKSMHKKLAMNVIATGDSFMLLEIWNSLKILYDLPVTWWPLKL